MCHLHQESRVRVYQIFVERSQKIILSRSEKGPGPSVFWQLEAAAEPAPFGRPEHRQEPQPPQGTSFSFFATIPSLDQ